MCVLACNSMCFKNVDLDVEALMSLNFVDVVVHSMKGSEEGKILVSMDCSKV